MKKVFETEFAGRHLSVETGEIAKQADGSALIRFGDTVVLATACCADEPKDGDFFPLTVNYEEKQYAIGKIPGSFLRREGRSGEHATLSARLIDRPIRPLFADGFRNEVQIVATVMSCDPDNTPEMTGLLGASLALCISDIPFDGPVAGVYVGRVDGKFIINPTVEEKEKSDIDLAVAGTEEAIMMVEAGAAEVPEEEMLDAVMFGFEAIKELCRFQKSIIAEIGKPKREISLYAPDPVIVKDIEDRIGERLVKAISIFDKLERQDAVDALKKEINDDYDSREYDSERDHNLTMLMVHDIEEKMVAKEVRRLITEEKIRPDGRKVDEIRPLDAQVDLLPRAHGSAMFTRGQTQVIGTTTLGPLSDKQIIDNLTGETSRRFMHHYNFPPYSVGEIGRMGAPGRREIGHGKLGERALSYVLPSEEEFPYTIRCVADVVESNGSSSQASICANCMSLMAAGVPIKGIVSGIAMGLITNDPSRSPDKETNHYTILTDIQGLEDHFGDMDFKCAGTAKGITALQMDIKIHGVTREVLSEALAQANKARAEIREVIEKAIPAPRAEVSKYAPKMVSFKIDTSKIREVIGKGGETIQGIIRDTGAQIDVEEDGTVTIYHSDKEKLEQAKAIIDGIVREAKVGEIFEGEVTRVENYGAFVNLFGNCDGLCHVSRLDWKYIEDANDVIKVGDTLKVVVIGIEEGKVKVSHREFIDKPADYVERPERPAGRPQGGNRGGHGNFHGGNRGGNKGGHR
ncbi:MAG: polyribonucleotide nucleotidyltransferase [Candidatus Enteromonas sp.]|nr:polyribonucleotide nucleotidyltransferase [Bacilli bacterium]MEE3401717.1 polyribonucleotide nucleotidyltransferase [Candidatus Enteromonas sp.]